MGSTESDKTASPSGAETQMLLEQYKAYLADLGNIGTRYTTSNGFYLSIVSALLAILALTKKGEVLERIDILLYILIPVFACLLCVIWRDSMLFYSGLFKTKFDVLRAMEAAGLPYRIFEKEEQLRERKSRRLITVEAHIPLILAIPFIAIFVYGIWAACRFIR